MTPAEDCNFYVQVHVDETKGTLFFASRANRVTNCAQVNEVHHTVPEHDMLHKVIFGVPCVCLGHSLMIYFTIHVEVIKYCC
jgi:hypothetical protein